MTTVIRGTHSDDNLSGTSGDDNFLMYQGGNDTVSGGDGNDVFRFGATLTADDHIDGGNGTDAVVLRGDYTAGVTFAAATMVNVEILTLVGSFDYNLTTDDATVAAGATLLVKASGIENQHSLIFDGSAETDGHFRFEGGAGDNVLTGGAQADVFHLENGPTDFFHSDTIHGGGGNDVFYLGAALTGQDTIDGGAGNDTLFLDGTYDTNLATISGIETIKLGAGHDYNLSSSSGVLDAGVPTLTVDGSALTSGDTLIWNEFANQVGALHIIAGAGKNQLYGGQDNDIFDLQHGTNQGLLAIQGGGGDDVFNVGANFDNYGGSSGTGINGGGGVDTLNIDGAYASTIQLIGGNGFLLGIDTVKFGAGHSYTVAASGQIADGALTIDGSALGAGDQLSVDLSAMPAGIFIGGAGDDTLTGSPGGDTIDLSHGGNDTAHGGAGGDTFLLGAALTAADTIDGGTGGDTVELDGDYSAGLTFSAATMTNVETLRLDDGFSYNLTTNDANVASGATLTVYASALTGANTLIFNGSAETDGSFHIIGGAGNDILEGGNQGDTITGGAGADTFLYTAVSQSESVHYDTITDFDANTDNFHLNTIINTLSTASGSVSTATFDTDLENMGLAVYQAAVVVTVTGGDLAGHTFLIADGGGDDSYLPGLDYVFDITGYTGTITLSDFTHG
jgi:Ca2+-binding RTX toxin-like protein